MLDDISKYKTKWCSQIIFVVSQVDTIINSIEKIADEDVAEECQLYFPKEVTTEVGKNTIDDDGE